MKYFIKDWLLLTIFKIATKFSFVTVQAFFKHEKLINPFSFSLAWGSGPRPYVPVVTAGETDLQGAVHGSRDVHRQQTHGQGNKNKTFFIYITVKETNAHDDSLFSTLPS